MRKILSMAGKLTLMTWIFLLFPLLIAAEGERCDCPPESVIGPETWSISFGTELADLQRFLARMGYYHGPVSGRFDAETTQAIKKFQRVNGLEETGIVDGPTWEALGDSVHGTPVIMKPPSDNIRLVIDLSYLSLTVLVDDQPFQSFPVAVGKFETPSPVGDWKIIKKGKWSGGFGTRWLGLNVPWGIFGIHGTNKPWSIGSFESHGCIRMFNQDVEEIFQWVRVGTPVHVIGDPFAGRRVLLRGERGPDVYFLQKRLRQLKLLDGPADGYFSYGTEKSVLQFQTRAGLKRTGQIGFDEYAKLGLLVRE